MATASPKIALPWEVQSLLAGLRWRIRAYVGLDAIAQVVIWLIVMFWVVLAVDYLPVLAGAGEMPPWARGLALVGVGSVAGWLLFRRLIERLLVPLPDRSLALLIERQHGRFQDSLVTSVEAAAAESPSQSLHGVLLSGVIQRARGAASDVSLAKIFNLGVLSLKLILGLLAVHSVLAFEKYNPVAFQTSLNRIYGLSSTPWPRSARIEVLGVDVVNGDSAEDAPRTFLPFQDRRLKLAKGSQATLRVRALTAPAAKVVPQKCQVRYHSQAAAGGVSSERGSVAMHNFRDADGYRQFSFDGPPFRRLLSSLTFDVVGYDHRLQDYQIEIVDSPAVVSTKLDLTYPSYLTEEGATRFLPVLGQEYLPSGTFIPKGTEVTLHFRSSKPLRQAQVSLAELEAAPRTTAAAPPTVQRFTPLPGEPDHFQFSLPQLNGSVSLQVTLEDQDGIRTEKPYRILLTAINDQPPVVDVRLKGIGNSVTPDVLIPVAGKVTDDYDAGSAWLALQLGEGSIRRVDLALGKEGAVAQELDFRKTRQDGGLELKPQDILFLTPQANDKCALASGPQTSSGDRQQLTVVTPDELLKQLELRELGLRRRFEVVIEEVSQFRDSLIRVKTSLSAGPAGKLPADDLPPEEGAKKLSPEQLVQREADLRILRLQRGLQQSKKSSQETRGVAEGFEGICAELINNRLDTADKRERLREQISQPLMAVVTANFAELDRLLAQLENALREQPSNDAAILHDRAAQAEELLAQANKTLNELEAILQKMLDLETYNEVVDLVRSLLDDQKTLLDKTQKERKRQALEDLK